MLTHPHQDIYLGRKERKKKGKKESFGRGKSKTSPMTRKKNM
jgi:hypothetical protein